MAKLWDKGYALDSLIEAFTVGNDYELDRSLVVADCLGSMAHARGLARAGIITSEDADALVDELLIIARKGEAGEFEIRPQDEDAHTAIEAELTERLGDLGKRIHTGRSRNDQIITALRIYGRSAIWQVIDATAETCDALFTLAETHAQTAMPGRTHLQIAMPTTFGLWAASIAEALTDDLELLSTARRLCDRGALGSAASYGVPLPLDRAYTSDLLGFERLQNNVLAVNNTRGRLELSVLTALESIMLTLSKMATDLILFSLPELGYVSLPEALCSGSSIMPQKRNPDGLELLRSRSGVVGGYASTVRNIVRSLPSGYNRDFQDTKEPFLRGLALTALAVRVAGRTVAALEVHPEKLKDALVPEVYATDVALDRVQGGESFRDAYRYVGTHLDDLGAYRFETALERRTGIGMPGAPGFDSGRDALGRLLELERGRQHQANAALSALAGDEVRVSAL
ncbi:MAG: argininosuccinate lyase [Spirochaetaceae bacterium]|nr:MAG: argininosuccinate lyase [Spirochaetaceae bacterium]